MRNVGWIKHVLVPGCLARVSCIFGSHSATETIVLVSRVYDVCPKGEIRGPYGP